MQSNRTGENHISHGAARGEVLFPGDFLCTSEEYLPGRNVSEENGNLYSDAFGVKQADESRLTMNVATFKKKVKLYPGQTVFGRVVKHDRGTYHIRIGAVSTPGSMPVEIDETVTFRERGRNDHFSDMRIGDLVRAKVVRTGRFVDITISEPNLGVVRALCHRCRNVLVLTKKGLWCDNCETPEKRKVASDYSLIYLDGEKIEGR